MTIFKEPKQYNWILNKCQKIGMKGILYKPVARKGLQAQVEKCLGKGFIQEMQEKSKSRVKKQGSVGAAKKRKKQVRRGQSQDKQT